MRRFHIQDISHNGFSITEVVVATLIFSLAVAGFFSAVTMLSQPAEVSNEEVTAAYLGKRILDEMRKSVDADPSKWNSTDPAQNPLSVGTHAFANVVIDGITYSGSYVMAADTEGTSGRKVTLTINW